MLSTFGVGGCKKHLATKKPWGNIMVQGGPLAVVNGATGPL